MGRTGEGTKELSRQQSDAASAASRTAHAAPLTHSQSLTVTHSQSVSQSVHRRCARCVVRSAQCIVCDSARHKKPSCTTHDSARQRTCFTSMPPPAPRDTLRHAATQCNNGRGRGLADVRVWVLTCDSAARCGRRPPRPFSPVVGVEGQRAEGQGLRAVREFGVCVLVCACVCVRVRVRRCLPSPCLASPALSGSPRP